MASISTTVTINLNLHEAKLLRVLLDLTGEEGKVDVFWKNLCVADKKIICDIFSNLQTLGD